MKQQTKCTIQLLPSVVASTFCFRAKNIWQWARPYLPAFHYALVVFYPFSPKIIPTDLVPHSSILLPLKKKGQGRKNCLWGNTRSVQKQCFDKVFFVTIIEIKNLAPLFDSFTTCSPNYVKLRQYHVITGSSTGLGSMVLTRVHIPLNGTIKSVSVCVCIMIVLYSVLTMEFGVNKCATTSDK